MSRLPVGQEPVLGRHITDLLDLFRSKATGFQLWHTDPANTGTTYVVPYASSDTGTESNAQLLIPRASTLSGFVVRHLTAGTSSRRLVYTVRLNGEDTSLSLSVAGTLTDPVSSTVRIPMAQFDRLSVKITRPDGSVATAPSNVLVSFEVV